MKKVILCGKNITPKQWSNLILELNLVVKAWKPYAKLEISGQGVKKIIKNGTTIRQDQNHSKVIVSEMCQQCVDSVKMFVLRGNWSAGRGIGEFWSKIIFFKKKKTSGTLGTPLFWLRSVGISE